MTNSRQANATASKLPTHSAYHVRDHAGGESYWTRIGSAWQHADGIYTLGTVK